MRLTRRTSQGRVLLPDHRLERRGGGSMAAAGVEIDQIDGFHGRRALRMAPQCARLK